MKEENIKTVQMIKAHISLNVRNIEQSFDFYKKMLGIEPSKVRTGYAKFDVQNPPLNLALNEGRFNERGALSHLGIQVATAVLPEFQGRRIGSKLVSDLLKSAASAGITEVALLTTTAKAYFEKMFDFKEECRTLYEDRLQNSPEWNLPRCSSATFMILKLKPNTVPVP